MEAARVDIIKVLSKHYPFSEREIKAIYDSLKSVDSTLMVLALAVKGNASLYEARKKYIELVGF